VNVPVPRPPLDRAALERVLARAAELQAQGQTDPGGALTDEQILDLGKEVGLAPDVLRQAMAEERGRVVAPESRGVAGTWLGASTISAVRVVNGTPSSVLSTLDLAMRRDLPFDVSRRFPDRTQWAPRRNFLDVVKEQLGRFAEGGDLRLAEEIAASVFAVDAQRTHVRIDATLTDARDRALKRSALGIAGAAGIAWLGLITNIALPAVVVMAAAAGGIGVFGAREDYRRRLVRVGRALEQILDRLEFGSIRA